MKLIPILSTILVFGVSLSAMELQQENAVFNKNFALQQEKISSSLNKAIHRAVQISSQAEIPISEISKNLITFSCLGKEHNESLDDLFKASEQLVINEDFQALKQHPLYGYFEALDNRELITTIKSGPDIQDLTTILLEKHELNIAKAHFAETISMKLFNNVETFFRCLEIFKNTYQKYTGKVIHCDLSYTLAYTPLDVFCEKYINDNPELQDITGSLFEQIVNLLSIFEIDDAIVSMDITLTMNVQEQNESELLTSFKPVFLHLNSIENRSSNDISIGQQNLSQQIQNLNGSELSMPYIKDADGREQFKALSSLLAKKMINVVEIGGGRGETNAVPYALEQAGFKINLLNVEPYEPFAKTYIEAHKSVGIDNVAVVQKTAQELSTHDVIDHFNGKADAVFASHSFYFILGDLHKATQAYIHGDLNKIEDHPLAKYFDMLEEDGVFVVTLQSGAGARLFRNALMNNHGLDLDTTSQDKTISLLRSFGNLATLLRHFEFFAKLYEQKTDRKIHIKMNHAVANVPLGGLRIEQDTKTGGYILHNPQGLDSDPSWLGYKMMDFYGNWKELQSLATLTFEDAQMMPGDDLKKLGIVELNEESLAHKREVAIKTQETFLHILRVFSPGLVNMQHPNITLTITVEANK